MKKVTLLSSLLLAGTLTFTGISGTAQADEEEGAKTVWGEILPADTDPDGDGWANTGFDPTWMSQDAQDRVSNLADEKDTGIISQVEFNEAVADIFQQEQQQQMDMTHQTAEDDANPVNHSQAVVTHEKMADSDMSVDHTHLAHLAMNEPEMLDAAPLMSSAYDFEFVHDGYFFHFSYDGTHWNWSYEEAKMNYTDEELMHLAHHDPEVLNQHPVKTGMYDFKLWDNHYVYHFASDSEHWTWAYEKK